MRNLEIKYSKQALKFLKKQDTITQKRILNAISVLPKGDVKALQGKDGYRLRIGDYRVIFNNIDNIIFIRMIGNRGQIYMTAVKERIIGAVSIMSDKDANIFWHIIQKHFKLPDTFADIEKVEPDETDLIMLKEIENNPDCHEFISQEELMKELNM